MPAPKGVTWKIDRHTEAKHAILRKYLEAWLPIMTSFNPEVVILDAFAGPGKYQDGEDGSPVIAIDVLRYHRDVVKTKAVKFIFIEADHDRCSHLRRIIAENPPPGKSTYAIYHGKCVDVLPTILTRLTQFSSAPVFAFLDPFGFSHTPMDLIAQLTRLPKSEVLITFMLEEIRRFIEHPDLAIQDHYDALFGCDAWRQIPQQAQTPKERESRIHDLYKQQLHQAANIRYVRSFRMRNKHNATDYYLFFGTSHPAGIDKMKEAMWDVDPTGAYEFSDFTDPLQPLLITKQDDYSQLPTMLLNRFIGQTVTLEDIEEFIRSDTGYPLTGYKTILKHMEDTNPPQIVVKGRTSRRGTFPTKDLHITFPNITTRSLF
jgi:three-Cys-motif partner protein